MKHIWSKYSTYPAPGKSNWFWMTWSLKKGYFSRDKRPFCPLKLLSPSPSLFFFLSSDSFQWDWCCHGYLGNGCHTAQVCATLSHLMDFPATYKDPIDCKRETRSSLFLWQHGMVTTWLYFGVLLIICRTDESRVTEEASSKKTSGCSSSRMHVIARSNWTCCRMFFHQ